MGGERAFVPLAVDRPVIGAPCILQQGELRQLHAQPKQHKLPLRLRDSCIDLDRDERHRRDRLQQHHLIRLALRIIDHEPLRRIHQVALGRLLHQLLRRFFPGALRRILLAPRLDVSCISRQPFLFFRSINPLFNINSSNYSS